ncbi:CheR family methyltransferase [Enterovirga aerilata]|uniref:protein-glutamate O-methyltransferase n=1 Tax=Enterovirga aerilata TaxID=2730920 RepID=A0A849IBK8_9HYPH|nr:protein-glutamate O-methyltransferase CheR [Enterovirga sp. DB1703]
MTEAEFAFLRAFLKQRSGLDLGPEKRYLAESRLRPLCRDAGLGSLGELVRKLRSGEDRGLADAAVVAMATHETMFFRDRTPFETLRTDILPRLVEARSELRRLRIWSAAASTGQEAYSVAMIVQEMGLPAAGWTIEILGTDISPSAVERARAGTYSTFEVQRGLPVRHLLDHFSQAGTDWTISPALRSAVEFRVLNLLRDFGGLGTFDVILCRNLAIYLDAPTKTALFERLARVLAPDGALCLGTSETVLGYTRTLVADPERRGFFLHATAAAQPERAYLAG